jgi:hypothetical protein
MNKGIDLFFAGFKQTWLEGSEPSESLEGIIMIAMSRARPLRVSAVTVGGTAAAVTVGGTAAAEGQL